MKSDSWFPCYPADLLANTAHLDNHDFGAYWRMLCFYYIRGPLPNDDQQLRRIACCDSQDWMRCRGMVMDHFTLNGDGRLHNKRADEEIARRDDLSERKRKQTLSARIAQGKADPDGLVTDSVTDTVTQNVTKDVTDVQVQPQSQLQVQPQSQSQKAFVRPTMDEMKLEAAKIGLPEAEIEAFFAHYESNGWKVGKNPMKSWRGAMITWRTNWQQGTFNANRGAANKPNPRNAGIAIDPSQQGRDIAAFVKRQEEERRAKAS